MARWANSDRTAITTSEGITEVVTHLSESEIQEKFGDVQEYLHPFYSNVKYYESIGESIKHVLKLYAAEYDFDSEAYYSNDTIYSNTSELQENIITFEDPTSGYRIYTINEQRTDSDYLDYETWPVETSTTQLWDLPIPPSTTYAIETLFKPDSSMFDSDWNDFTFTLRSDDGSVLYLNYSLETDPEGWLANHFGEHSVDDESFSPGRATLMKDTYNSLLIIVSNGGGAGQLQLTVTPDGKPDITTDLMDHLFYF